MKELRCPNCNGYINPKTYVCEYCGARFEKFSDSITTIKYVAEHPKVRTLARVMSVDGNDVMRFGADKVSEWCVKEMSRSLAEQLEPFITLEVEDDPYSFGKMVRGKVRLVDPSYRFI